MGMKYESPGTGGNTGIRIVIEEVHKSNISSQSLSRNEHGDKPRPGSQLFMKSLNIMLKILVQDRMNTTGGTNRE